MNLIPIPEEHPLRNRLIALAERANAQTDKVTALKQKIVERLLAWDQKIEAVKLDADGTFVREGVRERLQQLLPDVIAESIEIDGHGWIRFHDNEDHLLLGTLDIPHSDEWARQPFINTNCIRAVDEMTFSPESCLRYIDPKLATYDSNGGFQLNDEDKWAARIAMGAGYIRTYVEIARIISQEDGDASYRRSRVMMNLDDAMYACEWMERTLPPLQIHLEQTE
jgi:hypothetical protein